MRAQINRRYYQIGALVSGLLLLVISFGVKRSVLESTDLQLFEWFYDYQKNNVSLWLLITQMGSVLALGLSVVVTWFVGKQKTAYLLVGSGTIAYAICWVLKELVARPRPAVLLPTIQANDWSAVGYGFPSAHVAIITSVVLVLLISTRRSYKQLLWLAILLVALSRMFLGVHTPIDVLGGFLVGLFVFCATCAFVGPEKLKIE